MNYVLFQSTKTLTLLYFTLDVLSQCKHTHYLYSGIVFIHKVVLDKLDGESTFAHASSTHHHQFIFSHSSTPLQPLTTPKEKSPPESIQTIIPLTVFMFSDFSVLKHTNITKCNYKDFLRS